LFSRYRTGALTRRVAVQMGHYELGVKMNSIQRVKGRIGALILPILKSLEHVTPYSWVYRRLIGWILFTATYKGFYTDELPTEFASSP
jgi:hypothetical protein